MPHLIGNCLTCGYPLFRLTTHRCPECGREFDPTDPSTMEFHPSKLKTFLLKRITIWTFLPVVFMAALLFVISRVARGSPATGLVTLATILTVFATTYVVLARLRFRVWLRRRKLLSKFNKAGNRPGQKPS